MNSLRNYKNSSLIFGCFVDFYVLVWSEFTYKLRREFTEITTIKTSQSENYFQTKNAKYHPSKKADY